jgi:hypothetical protein
MLQPFDGNNVESIQNSLLGHQCNPYINGLGLIRLEGTGFPAIFYIEADPREENNILALKFLLIFLKMSLVTQWLNLSNEYFIDQLQEETYFFNYIVTLI